MIKEYNEFTNPEENNYDITSSLKDDANNNPYSDEIMNLVGILEDGEWENYGITEEEYLNPTQNTVDKIIFALNTHKSR